MPQLRQDARARMDSCPDSALLTAFAEEQVTSFEREAVSGHLAHCKKCSDICVCLANFARVSVPAQDAEWVNADKRLENWMDGFLRSQAAEMSQSLAEPATPLSSSRARERGSWWKLPWAFAAAAVVLAFAAGVVVSRHGSLSSAPVEVAAIPAQQPANPTVAPAAQGPAAAPIDAKPAEPAQKPAAGIRKSAAPPTRHESPETDESAKADTVPVPASNPPQTITPDKDTPSEIAHDYTPPDLSPNDRIASKTPMRLNALPRSPAAMAHASAPVRATPAPPVTTGASMAPSDHAVLLAPMRFDAGARLWIRVVSISRQRDGSFTFHGTLLQPASQSGGAILDQGAELAGSGSVKDGKTTVLIKSILSRGEVYAVQGPNAALGEAMSGAGNAVEFDDGRVLEMWLSSATVYQPASAGSLDQGRP